MTRIHSHGPRPSAPGREPGRFAAPARPFVFPARRREEGAGDPAAVDAGAGRLGHLLDGVQVHAERPTAAAPPANSPIQRVEIPPEERAKPREFMQARAHLAAVLTGANVDELGAEVDSSRRAVNRWQSTQEGPVGEGVADTLREHTLGRDYTTLHRFQDEPEHNLPRIDENLSGIEQVRALHGGEYSEGGGESVLDHLGAAYLGARHTKGDNQSSFVSLIDEPEKLTRSQDTGPQGARTIAQQAKQLHTYTVPKHLTWDPDRLSRTMGTDLRDETTGTGETYGEWLASTPAEEGEVLYHGGDLDRYRTRQQANPFRPKGKKKGGRR